MSDEFKPEHWIAIAGIAGTLLGTMIGAAIGAGSTLWVHTRQWRREDQTRFLGEKRQACAKYLASLVVGSAGFVQSVQDAAHAWAEIRVMFGPGELLARAHELWAGAMELSRLRAANPRDEQKIAAQATAFNDAMTRFQAAARAELLQ